MTTKNDIKDWLKNAPNGSTHMLVVCDTFDHSDYPSYTNDPVSKVEYFRNESMQRVMEVYDLSKNVPEQLDEHRAWNL